jgi:hypothetical protein
MTDYPIVLKDEPSGTVSAFVVGLPVYAVAETRAKAVQAIHAILAAYLAEHPEARIRKKRGNRPKGSTS